MRSIQETTISQEADTKYPESVRPRDGSQKNSKSHKPSKVDNSKSGKGSSKTISKDSEPSQGSKKGNNKNNKSQKGVKSRSNKNNGKKSGNIEASKETKKQSIQEGVRSITDN